MTGNAAKNKNRVWISYPDAFRVSKKAIDLLIGAGIDVGLYNFPLCAVDKMYRSLCEKSISDYKIRYTERCEKMLSKRRMRRNVRRYCKTFKRRYYTIRKIKI